MRSESAKHNQITTFVKKLPNVLKQKFGWSNFYTNEQVEYAILSILSVLDNDETLNFEDVCYAFAMFCTPQEFGDAQKDSKVPFDYYKLRREVTEYCFTNENDFSFSDIESLSLSDSMSSSTNDFGGFGDVSGGGE